MPCSGIWARAATCGNFPARRQKDLRSFGRPAPAVRAVASRERGLGSCRSCTRTETNEPPRPHRPDATGGSAADQPKAEPGASGAKGLWQRNLAGPLAIAEQPTAGGGLMPIPGGRGASDVQAMADSVVGLATDDLGA